MKEETNISKQCERPLKTVCIAVLLSLILFSCAGLFINDKARHAYEQGLTLFNEGKFLEAIPYFEEAVSREPDFYNAHLYLGKSYLNLRNYGKAIPPLRKACRLSPRSFRQEIMDLFIDALLGAAYSELKEGNIQVSLQYIREVLSLDPRSQKIKDDLSSVLVAVATNLYKNDKVRDAVTEFTEAIKANPDNPRAYLGLAKALLKSGELGKALEAAEKSLALDPGSNEALNVIKKLLKK